MTYLVDKGLSDGREALREAGYVGTLFEGQGYSCVRTDYAEQFATYTRNTSMTECVAQLCAVDWRGHVCVGTYGLCKDLMAGTVPHHLIHSLSC